VVCRVWAAVGGDEPGLLLAGCCEGDRRRRRSVEMGGAPLVSVKAEWVGACEGEREIVAEGLWRLRRRWVAGYVGLAGTSLLGGGAERKDRGKRGR
jgi:hypothetical protein